MTPAKLPFHPIYAVIPYAALALVPVLAAQDIETPDFALVFCGLAIAALQVGWTYQAMQFAASVSGDQRQIKLARWAILLFAVGIPISIGLQLVAGQISAEEAPSTLVGLMGIPLALCCFAYFWFAGRAIAIAERKDKANAFVLFLLLFYFAIGVFFVYRRLKALAAQEKTGVPN